MDAVAEEFLGKFEPDMTPDKDDLDQTVFKPFRDKLRVQFAEAPEGAATITAGRFYDPATDKAAILTLHPRAKINIRALCKSLGNDKEKGAPASDCVVVFNNQRP